MKKAFTLAETLITLLVIGVVAALTIPALTQMYKKHVVSVKITQFYKIWSELFERSQVDNGPVSEWSIDENYSNYDVDNAKDKPLAEKYLTPYLNIVNTDRTSVKRVGNDGDFYLIYQPNGNQFSTGNMNMSFYRLQNGICIYPNINPTGRMLNGGKEIAQAWFDINCEKSPNMLGKDIFVFSTFESEATKSLYTAPRECPRDLTTAQLNRINQNCASGIGYDCTYWILKDGFNKIPNDYPWL